MGHSSEPGTTIIVPIAADLAWDADHNQVVCGPMTKRACDEACKIAQNTPNSIVLLTATRAGPEYDEKVMGLVMRDYIRQTFPGTTTTFQEASTFDTLGEVEAVVSRVRVIKMTTTVKEVILVVKKHHEARTQMIADALFRFLPVKVSFEPHVIPASIPERIRRSIYEFVATAKNRRKLKKFNYI